MFGATCTWRDRATAAAAGGTTANGTGDGASAGAEAADHAKARKQRAWVS